MGLYRSLSPNSKSVPGLIVADLKENIQFFCFKFLFGLLRAHVIVVHLNPACQWGRNCVLSVSRGCFKDVSMMLQGYFNNVSRMFQGFFKAVS